MMVIIISTTQNSKWLSNQSVTWRTHESNPGKLKHYSPMPIETATPESISMSGVCGTVGIQPNNLLLRCVPKKKQPALDIFFTTNFQNLVLVKNCNFSKIKLTLYSLQ